MQVKFVKMTGAGNDFVVADNRDGGFPVGRAEIARICDRRFGVGADGVLLVEASQKADFFMRYYNADGSEAEMCGNGARCIARFYADRCGAKSRDLKFETRAGLIEATVLGERVRLKMTEPRDIRLGQRIQLGGRRRQYHFANTGVPHVVLFSRNVAGEAVAALGPKIRHHPDFAPHGTNVNWLQRLDGNAIRVRTYERGVEAETPACGTGVTACAIIAHLVAGLNPPIRVRVQSGRTLEVDFAREGDAFCDVYLTGPAEYAFAGQLL